MNKATLDRIVTLLHERGPMGFASIMHAIGLEEAALDDMLDVLIDAGVVGELPDGRLILTDWAAERFARAAEVVAASIASEVDDG